MTGFEQLQRGLQLRLVALDLDWLLVLEPVLAQIDFVCRFVFVEQRLPVWNWTELLIRCLCSFWHRG